MANGEWNDELLAPAYARAAEVAAVAVGPAALGIPVWWIRSRPSR
jgi:hypothetical protein